MNVRYLLLITIIQCDSTKARIIGFLPSEVKPWIAFNRC